MKHFRSLALLSACPAALLPLACGTDDGSLGILLGATTVSYTTPLDAGDNDCPEGGLTIFYGADLDGDGVLSESETSGEAKVCNGTSGNTGTPGSDGADGNDGQMGIPGNNGEDGTPGSDGEDGAPGNAGGQGPVGNAGGQGPMGDPGEDGDDASAVPLEVGNENCPAGGYEIFIAGESIGYLCNGGTGQDALIVEESAIAPGSGSTCPYGGTLLQWGPDEDREGDLDPEEISGSLTTCAAAPTQCNSSPFVASSPAELALLSACNDVIQGSVTVRGPAIVSLASLASVEEIQGSLRIESTTLTDLTGLANLETIGGDLVVDDDNDSLTSLSGLGALTSIGQNLSLLEAALPSNFSALSSLDTLGGQLSGGPSFTDFQGLENLTTLHLAEGELPDSIGSFDGLDNVTTLGADLLFTDATSFVEADIAFLSKLEVLDGDLIYSSSSPMASVGNLAALREVTGTLHVSGGATDLDLLLDGITTVGGDLKLFSINDDPGVYLTSLETVGRHLEMKNTPLIVDLSGLSNVTAIGANLPADHSGYSLDFFGSTGMTICGMSSLTTLNGSLRNAGGSIVGSPLATLNADCP